MKQRNETAVLVLESFHQLDNEILIHLVLCLLFEDRRCFEPAVGILLLGDLAVSGIETGGEDVLAVLVLDEALVPGGVDEIEVEDLLGALAGKEDDAGDARGLLELMKMKWIEFLLLGQKLAPEVAFKLVLRGLFLDNNRRTLLSG